MDPQDRKYTQEHEWVSARDGGVVRFGITDYAQGALGDIVYVSLPKVGDQLTAGAACGEVESTKSVSDVFSPVSGTVVAVNEALDSAPETVNTDPYEAGWMVEVETGDSLDALLDAAAYGEFVSGL